MTQIYKNIIIGASIEGLQLAKMLPKDHTTLIISQNFVYGVPDSGIDTYEGTVVHLAYLKGLFGVTVQKASSCETVYGLNLILATGTKPIEASFKHADVHYKAADVSGRHKLEVAVVYGSDADATDYALELSKKFCYVHLCTPGFNIPGTVKQIKQVANRANISHLPGCVITTYKANSEGKLTTVITDIYGSINASTLVIALGRKPDVPTWADSYIEVDSEGFLPIKSTLVPRVFAVGALCKQYSTREARFIIETLAQEEEPLLC